MDRLQDNDREAAKWAAREGAPHDLPLVALDALAAHVAVIDATGRIVFVNRAWRDYAQRFGANGSAGLVAGADYLAACRRSAETETDAADALRGILSVLEGKSASYTQEYLCPTPFGQTWYRMDVAPMALASGPGAILTHLEVTPQKSAEIAIRKSERNLRAMFQNAGVGIAEIDADGGWLRANARLRQILQLKPPDLRAATLLSLSHPDEQEAHRAQMKAMHEDADPARAERRLRRSDGAYVWVDLTLSCVRKADGRIDHFVAVIVDIDERKLAEERQRHLMRELAHRGKNLLAVIDSIAMRTLRGDGTLQSAREALSGRLHALAATYDSLIHESFEGVLLKVALRNELAAFGARAQFEGPRVMLTVKAAQTFGLLAHELATNAVKYGALSAPGGQIAIRWSQQEIDGEPSLAFDWRETGGPPIQAPTRRGFGSEILEKVAGSEFECRPTLDFAPSGFHYRFEAPLARIGAVAHETPLRGRLRQPHVLAVYDEWLDVMSGGVCLPHLEDIDWQRLLGGLNVAIARVTASGDVSFAENGAALRLDQIGESPQLTRQGPALFADDTESFMRCAHELAPRHEFLRLDFPTGAPALFERLLLPFHCGNAPGAIFVVGVAAFDDSRAVAP